VGVDGAQTPEQLCARLAELSRNVDQSVHDSVLAMRLATVFLPVARRTQPPNIKGPFVAIVVMTVETAGRTLPAAALTVLRFFDEPSRDREPEDPSRRHLALLLRCLLVVGISATPTLVRGVDPVGVLNPIAPHILPDLVPVQLSMGRELSLHDVRIFLEILPVLGQALRAVAAVGRGVGGPLLAPPLLPNF
jgi:hypothetical protein